MASRRPLARPAARVAVVALAATLAGGVGASAAYADTPAPTDSTAPVASDSPAASASPAPTSGKHLAAARGVVTHVVNSELRAIARLEVREQHARVLTADHRTALLVNAAAEGSALATLKTKVASDSDLSTLRADARTAVSGLHTVGFLTRQYLVVAAADSAAATATRLQAAHDRLAASAGSDTTATTALDDMAGRLAEATAEASAAATAALAVDMNAPDRHPFDAANADLRVAAEDERTAGADARAAARAERQSSSGSGSTTAG